MTVSIAPATREDGPAIVRLLAASGLPEVGILDHLETAYVARNKATLLGCAALEVYDDGVLVRSVAVAPAARGLGLGERLVRTVLDRARQLGAPAVFLLTTTAERYFPRFGFTRVGRADVPPGVQQSVEFQGACCASAVVMRLTWPAPAPISGARS